MQRYWAAGTLMLNRAVPGKLNSPPSRTGCCTTKGGCRQSTNNSNSMHLEIKSGVIGAETVMSMSIECSSRTLTDHSHCADFLHESEVVHWKVDNPIGNLPPALAKLSMRSPTGLKPSHWTESGPSHVELA